MYLQKEVFRNKALKSGKDTSAPSTLWSALAALDAASPLLLTSSTHA
jgi:hypothetical protein